MSNTDNNNEFYSEESDSEDTSDKVKSSVSYKTQTSVRKIHTDDNHPNIFAKPKATNRVQRILFYLSFSLISFFMFLYLTFPYSLIKEGAVSYVSEHMAKDMALDMRINMTSLKPNWLTGIELENLTITNTKDSSVNTKFGLIKARVSILPIFIGRLTVNFFASQAKGNTEGYITLSLLDLMRGKTNIKSSEINFRNFPVDALINQLLSLSKNSASPSMTLLAPILSVTTAGGNIIGFVRLASATNNQNDDINGTINISLKNMYLHIADNVWQIPRQEFSKATIKAKLDGGAIIFEPGTTFVAPDIDLTLGGRVGSSTTNKNVTEASLSLKLSLRGKIQQNIGNLVPAFLKCMQPLQETTLADGQKENILQARLIGPVASMTCEQ